MLQKHAIDPGALSLLMQLMQMDVFSGLRLAGGTALALQIGHRRSVDLDLFGEVDFEAMDTGSLFSVFQQVTAIKRSENINIYSINHIKVDFVNYHYPWLKEVKKEGVIRLARLPDIAAMKLAAVTGRGSRKDFIDIYYLLKHFSLKEMIGFYLKKYYDASEFLLLKSLTFFEDAESDAPIDTTDNIPWETVKKDVLKEVAHYNQSLL